MALQEKSMGKKANPAVIGAFVIGAIALALIGVIVFGSGQMFKHTAKFVCFFTGNVNGLNVGAPVRFKGVDVGSVTDIRLRLGGSEVVQRADIEKGVRIPVFIEIDQEKVALQGGRRNLGDPAQVKRLVDLGLRAQLNAQSLVTGLLFIQLDFYPDKPATFVLPPESKPPEIPTIPTTMEQVQSVAAQIISKLEEIHFDTMVKSATEVLDSVKGVVNSPGLKQTIETLPTTVTNINQAVTSLRELTARIDGKQGPFFDSLKGTSDKTSATLEQARLTLQTVQTLVDPSSPLATQLGTSLQEITRAARSMRLLADYLERNPSSLVRGRGVNEGGRSEKEE
jgi:paraquat-inducible protein B